MRRTGSTLLAAVALVIFTPLSFAQATDPQLGTWKLNVSKWKPADPTAKPQRVPATLVIEGVENGHHFVSDFVDAQGRKVHTEYVAKYDGKEYPRVNIVAGVPAMSTVSIRVIDPYTYEYTFKSPNGQPGIQRTVISRDGKTRTNTQTVTSPQGQKGTNVVVYDKVS
jgi:hypothetical protein